MSSAARSSPFDPTLAAMVVALAATAGITLLGWGASPLAAFLEREAVVTRWPIEATFFLDWTMMCVAMMLPTTVPLLVGIRRIGARRGTAILTPLAGLGFLAVWLAFGGLVRLVAVELADVDTVVAFVGRNQRAFVGVGLVAAGAYATTPLAQRCATACRSPMSFVSTLWTGAAPRREAFVIGWSYGLSCFGCCWPQMLLLSLVGMSNPFWMLIGTLAMIAQKSRLVGAVATRATSLALAGAGAAVLAGWVDPEIDDMLWRSMSLLCRSVID